LGRRSDHSRKELYAMALATAQAIAEEEGLRGLTARRITREIGYTIGTFYSLFDNFDDLVLRLNGTTVDALYEVCAAVPLDGEPEAALHRLADRYIGFTRAHPKRWRILFEHHLPDGEVQPDWYREKILRLLGLVETALAPLFPPGQEAERLHAARVLWSSLHGICSLEAVDKLVSTETVEALSDSLITNYLVGLRTEAEK
jgi:AcrR family transcriptional regulator